MKNRIKEVTIIILLALVFGAVYNAFSNPGLPYIYQEKTAEFVSGQVVNLKQAKEMHEDTSIVFLDARPARYYNREHIPGAVNVPYNTKELEKLVSSYKKDQKFVVYCYSESCNYAKLLGDLLAKNNFENIALFDEGIKAWKEKYPTDKPQE